MPAKPADGRCGTHAILCLGLLLLAGGSVAGSDDSFFESKIRPVLAGTCLRCHGGQKVSGKLRLDSRESLLKGGSSGPAVVPGNPDGSLLIKAIRYQNEDLRMPPGKPLPAQTVADLTAWVKAGAAWPAQAKTLRAERHWAFEPVRRVEPPADPTGWSLNEVDRFVAAKRRGKGLQPVGPADRRTLIRRATFDLTGLPPTPEAVKDFVRDPSADAYDRLVERLLASPQYGERWGRHWLDVVRYADTAGETADFPVPDAWRYRNYVIAAFNQDRPYDEFLREQLAGDVLARRLPPGAPSERYAELVTATGCIASARRFGFDILKDQHLTIEDTIDTLGKSVLGLTIACARCHDHKFDPITTTDYYSLYGIFDSTRYPFPGCEHTKVPRDMAPLATPDEMQAKARALQQALARCAKERTAANERVRKPAAAPPFLTVSGDIPNGGAQDFAGGTNAGALKSIHVRHGDMIVLTVLPKANHGADSTLVELEIAEQNGSARSWNLTRQVLPDFCLGNPHPDGLGNAGVWYFLDVAQVPTLLTEFVNNAFNAPGLQVWRGAADTPLVFANPGDRPVAFQTVRQPPRSVAVHPGPSGGVAVAWQSPIEGVVAVRGRVQDIDPSGGDGIAWKIEHRPGFGAEVLAARDANAAWNDMKKRAECVADEYPRAYAVAEGTPHNVRLQKRGDPETLGEEVPRRNLQLLGGQPVPPDGGSGRLALAQWLTRPDNPLTARVMVNRIWQHHFGTGLVATPNDFGTRGVPPSNPELLDYLAARFVREGWSVKAMHRLIMKSATYRLAAHEDPRNAQIDPDDTWLWRFRRRRLGAEEIRDSILAVSGDLDRSPGGPHPFPDRKAWGFTQHAPFTAVYETNRRSVYLMTQRIKRHPFLALFDGPDPNSSTPGRYSTIVPTQALFFMNDPFVHASALHLAGRLLSLPDSVRLDRAFGLLFGRAPAPEERSAAARFLAGYEEDLADLPPAQRPERAWAAYVRVLLSSNEFLFVD